VFSVGAPPFQVACHLRIAEPREFSVVSHAINAHASLAIPSAVALKRRVEEYIFFRGIGADLLIEAQIDTGQAGDRLIAQFRAQLLRRTQLGACSDGVPGLEALTHLTAEAKSTGTRQIG